MRKCEHLFLRVCAALVRFLIDLHDFAVASRIRRYDKVGSLDTMSDALALIDVQESVREANVDRLRRLSPVAAPLGFPNLLDKPRGSVSFLEEIGSSCAAVDRVMARDHDDGLASAGREASFDEPLHLKIETGINSNGVKGFAFLHRDRRRWCFAV